MDISWEEVEAAFIEAEALHGDARAAYLDRLPSLELRREVESMLQASSGATNALHDLVGDAAESLANSEESLKEIGPYQLIRLLGVGGMGAVYQAERHGEGFRQTAALKLLRPGFGGQFFVGRFRQERRILASLEHPNIARMLDGGTAPDGRPYLVMEYVDGETLLEYSEHNQLSMARRLGLFLDVCKAVEHAHQRMVIHRDLKPSNILVTRDGRVKLLDFGIAKITNPEATDGSVAVTGTDVKLMTPDYSSPEQVRGGAITTATDVYCLGLVLYELLTGRKPLALPQNAPLEAARIVCEQEPAKTALPPDLDAVIRKCLRKEPTARYAGVASLREDLERSLRGEPVTAYRGDWSYRAGRWVRRYRWLVAAVSVVMLAILGGVIATTREARIAGQRYLEVRRLARSVIFDVYDEVALLPGATKAREKLVTTGLQYLEGLRSEARRDPDLAMELAEAYLKIGEVFGNPLTSNLGRPADAKKAYLEAKGLYERVAADDPGRSGVHHGEALALHRLASLAVAELDLSAADRLLSQADSEELREKVDDRKRDWSFLLQLDLERANVAGWSSNGAQMNEAAERGERHVAKLMEVNPGPEARYWQLLVEGWRAMAEAHLGEPTHAYESITKLVGRYEAELKAGSPVVWLRRDLSGLFHEFSALQSGVRYPSLGNPAAAVAEFDRVLKAQSGFAVHDENDMRPKEDSLMFRLEVLPAVSQVSPGAGVREYTSIRRDVEAIEAGGNASPFDVFDHSQLFLGGARAYRLLRRWPEAAALARDGLKNLEGGSGSRRSAVAAHCENLLRFELAQMGIDTAKALEVARRSSADWPNALLLQADVVKVLVVSGSAKEAESALERMPLSEYRTRLKRELKVGKFSD